MSRSEATEVLKRRRDHGRVDSIASSDPHILAGGRGGRPGLPAGPVWATTSPRRRPRPRIARRRRRGEGRAVGPGRCAAVGTASELSAFFGQPGDDPPRPFVPLRPATVDDRRRIEAVRLYQRGPGPGRPSPVGRRGGPAPGGIEARSRLGRDRPPPEQDLYRRDGPARPGHRIRPEGPGHRAGRYRDARPAVRLLHAIGSEKSDSAAAEALLKEVLANPKLDAHAPGRLLAEFELGKLYADRLRQIEKAADAYAKVIDALDDKSANRLSPADQARDPGQRPVAWPTSISGLVFIAAKRDELAVRALERAMVYDEDNPQIALVLAETLLRLRKADQALVLVERIIKRQPQGVEAYELLAKVLTALGREKEITPRLEEAAQRDSKNVPLQYVLADRYRETGQVDKAEALYKALLTLAADAADLPGAGRLAPEAEEGRRPAQGDLRGRRPAEHPGGGHAAAPGRRRR